MSAFFRLIAFALVALSAARAQQPAATSTPAPATPTPADPKTNLTSPVDAARQKIADAVKRMSAPTPDADGALASLTQAIQLKPDSAFAYILRGSIYSQRKQFAEAEADFNAAAKIDPNNFVIKFNLTELKFMQKQYDEARVGFLPLQKDPDMGDFATYKVYLCDLFAGHEDVAKSELDAFNKKGEGCGYYFANAAWFLYHKNIEDARTWLVSASHIFAAKKFTMYGESLRYLGYLPIPEPTGTAASQSP
jgi:Tfp pilus assembly protein PilF